MRVLLAVVLCCVPALADELFNDRVAAIEPFEREFVRGKPLSVKGVLKGAYETPELIIIAPDGRTFLNKDNVSRGKNFEFTVRFEDGPGAYRMEVIARKSNSIKSAARFTVWYAVPRRPDKRPPVSGAETPRTIHPRLIEKRFVRLLNGFRKSIRLKPVGWNEAVAARTREHAERMARAQRRQHKFGRAGTVKDMLATGGAGPSGHSGLQRGWINLTGRRPFPRPAVVPPADRPLIYVVTFVLAETSLEAMFERFFVREAAFRICAADPNCLEIAVGAARTQPPAPKSGEKAAPPSALVYYCVSFVQVNNSHVVRGQNQHFAALVNEASSRHPDVLRRVGIWGRETRALTLCKRALADKRPEVAGAAFDAYLLLDEPAARAHYEKAFKKRAGMIERRQYGAAIASGALYRFVRYDEALAAAARQTEQDLLREARAELSRTLALTGPERTNKLKDLARRVKGLPLAEQIENELKKSD